MAACYGNIGEFDPEEEPIHVYLKRVQLFMDANSVKKEKQKSVLLSVIGPKVYGILRSLLAPQLPSADDVSFDDIMGALKSHYDPKPSGIAERFHFYRRAQSSSESISEYVAELKRLATHCATFESQLETALRDRLVSGLRQESLQKRLLAEKDLTFKKAVEIAKSVEAAEKITKEMKSNNESAIVVHAVSKPPIQNHVTQDQGNGQGMLATAVVTRRTEGITARLKIMCVIIVTKRVI
jgi:hypothetical protein